MSILIAILVISILGLLLGLGLAIADKLLAVEKDEKLLALEAIMPGANCGGCGYAGCQAYAEAVSKNEAELGLCAPGGVALDKQMGEIMGLSVNLNKKRMVAYVHCMGHGNVVKNFEYQGLKDCNAAMLLHSGFNACNDGCLNLGSCMNVCPTGAISYQEGKIEVDTKLCIGCKKCISVCPTGAIKMIPEDAEYVVKCNNHDAGAKAKKSCKAACIGCKLCVNKVESSACVVDKFLCSIDYEKDQTSVEKSAEVCPQKCIVKR